MIVALRDGDEATRQVVREALSKKDASALPAVQAALQSCDALGYTQRAAEREIASAKAALEVLPPSPYREALGALADFALHRAH